MRFGGLLWWLGAMAFAILAGILTFNLLNSRSIIALSPKNQGDTTPVVVAGTDIPFRRSIGENELHIRELPTDAVPEGAATSIDQVVGKMSTVDIFTSEPILIQQLVTPDIVTQQVALSIPEGKIVMAVPTDSELVRNRLVRPGDHIDLLATFKVEIVRKQSSSPMPESVSLLQNLEVHAIIVSASVTEDDAVTGPKSKGGVFQTLDEEAQSVLLAVNMQDALTIRHILDVDGRIDLALRAPTDQSQAEAVAVDQFYLADRYQIELVRDLDLTGLVRQ